MDINEFLSQAQVLLDPQVQFDTQENIGLFNTCTAEEQVHLVTISLSLKSKGITLTPRIFHDCCKFLLKEDLANFLESMGPTQVIKIKDLDTIISNSAPKHHDFAEYPFVQKCIVPEIFSGEQLKEALKIAQAALKSSERAGPRGCSLFKDSAKPNEGSSSNKSSSSNKRHKPSA